MTKKWQILGHESQERRKWAWTEPQKLALPIGRELAKEPVEEGPARWEGNENRGHGGGGSGQQGGVL